MGRFVPVVLILIFTGCKERENVSKRDLDHLNGYWEIEKVVLPDGAVKVYGANTTIDFFEVKGSQGYRKKVQPKIDGSFATSDDAESFTLIEDNGVFSIHYENAFSEWTERIEKITHNKLALVNEENISYHYKRFQPLLQHGKTKKK